MPVHTPRRTNTTALTLHRTPSHHSPSNCWNSLLLRSTVHSESPAARIYFSRSTVEPAASPATPPVAPRPSALVQGRADAKVPPNGFCLIYCILAALRVREWKAGARTDSGDPVDRDRLRYEERQGRRIAAWIASFVARAGGQGCWERASALAGGAPMRGEPPHAVAAPRQASSSARPAHAPELDQPPQRRVRVCAEL